MLKKFTATLLVAGICAFFVAGCATMKGATDLICQDERTTELAACIPPIPALPAATEDQKGNAQVLLVERDMRDLLIYFRSVEHCREVVQGVGP
jgi:hypothetical protein